MCARIGSRLVVCTCTGILSVPTLRFLPRSASGRGMHEKVEKENDISCNDDDDENDDDGSGEAKGSESHIENYSISVSTLLANSKMNHRCQRAAAE